MNGFNFEKCNGCPYYFGEIDQCMVGEDDVNCPLCQGHFELV